MGDAQGMQAADAARAVQDGPPTDAAGARNQPASSGLDRQAAA
jgi:hypothetical protein